MKRIEFSLKNVAIWTGLLLSLVLTFFVVYSPHLSYPYPYHIDEWHHISQSKRLLAGDYMNSQEASGFGVIEMGFHVLLLGFSKVFDLIANYKYLPASWAVLTAWTFYFVVSRKTGNRLIGIFAIVFFASLKSNVNILGLWFFTPLIFSFPFLILYSYFFSEGVLRENKRYLVGSLALMFFLIPSYATSVLFLIPTALVFLYLNREYVKRESRLFLVFLIIPILGMAFYKMAIGLSWGEVFDHLQKSLQFKYGWGVLELKNSWTELYSVTGYLLAAVGALYILIQKKIREYSFYLIWAASLLFSIEIYREFGVSFLAPYQRNLYYFGLIMPLFSALGLHYLISQIKSWHLPKVLTRPVKIGLPVLLLAVTLGLIFINYYKIPWQLDLYKVINKGDYDTLLFMKTLAPARVMTTTYLGTALYPIAGHRPYATIYFLGNPEVVDQFYNSGNCGFREEIIKNRRLDYVISPFPLDCDWPIVYDQQDQVYRVSQIYLNQNE